MHRTDADLNRVVANPAFRLEVAKTPALELVLSYRAIRPVSIAWRRFEAGAAAQITIATEDTVRVAVAAAHKMHGCRGMMFFRWPGWDDALVMQPDEVLEAAGVAPATDPKPRIATIDGSCTAVHCVDLYLVDPRPASAPARRFRVNSSAEHPPETGLGGARRNVIRHVTEAVAYVDIRF